VPILSHEVVASCSADAAFIACRDVSEWPAFMPAVRSAKFLEQGPAWDVIEITAEANEKLWTWTSRRRHDFENRTIEFERLDPPEGVIAMRGRWCIVPAQNGKCSIRLHHEFVVQQGRNDVEEFLTRSIKNNASRDLEALASHVPLSDSLR
jgi:ribosome-associated toxin RatA of RatAB toxin-antitoxin module